jgi:hypothetical protein
MGALGSAVALMLVAGCAALGSDGTSAPKQRPPEALAASAAPRIAYAYLVSGEVVAVSLATGRILARRDLGTGPSIRLSTPLLTQGPDHSQLYALTPQRTGRAQRVVRLGADDLAVRSDLRLPGDVTFTAIEAGPRTGTLYLFGTRRGAPVLATADGALTRIDTSQQLRAGGGRHWLVIAATVDAAESRLIVSYHGETTTGADVVDVSGSPALPTVVACAFPGGRGLGCLHDVHGTAAFVGDELAATTGSRAVVVLDAAGGTVKRRLDSELPQNHLMTLAAGPGADTVVVVGSCTQAGGVSVLDVANGDATRRGYPARRQRSGYRGVCGDSVATWGDTAVIAAPDPVGRGQYPTGLFLLDLRAGGGDRTRFVRMASPLALLLPRAAG